MKLPEKKMIIIIAAAVIAVAAIGGTLMVFSGKDSSDDRQRPRRFTMTPDPNLPNPEKQKPQEIIAYMDSEEFKQLSSGQKMNYMFSSGRKVMEYQMDTYAALPEEEKTEFLDSIIDRMDSMRQEMAQYRDERRDQRQLERQNNPDSQQQTQRNRRSRDGRRGFDPARRRAMSERGTPEQRAIRRQFFTALSNRAEQRGIEMPGPGRGGR